MMRRQSLSLLSAHLRRLQQHNGHVSSSDATISLASSLEPSLLEPPLVDSSPERGHESASPLFALTRWWSPQFASNQASPFASPTLQSVLQLPSEPSPERNRESLSPLFALNQTPRRRNPSALAWSHGACSRSTAVSVSPVNRRSDEAFGFGRPSLLLRVPTKQPLRLSQLLLLSAGFSTDASSGSPQPPMPADLAAVVERRLSAIMARHQQLEELLSQPDTSADDLARAGKEMSELAPAVAIALELQKKTKELEDLHALLRGQEQHYKEDKEGAEGKTEGDREVDEELRAMVEEEAGVVGREREGLLRSAVRRILPRDEADSRGCILEVRAGTGGDEAALFAVDIFHMYQRFCAKRGWQFEILDVTEIEKGGYKEASASISGDGAFGWLKGESGVHRVQRVPTTEKAGRVHTSAATVAVLPQADEVDVSVRQEELRIDTYRSGGAGGQSVNTTSSAVRITHIPTGIVVAIQDERSQHQNKAKALKVLRARLFDAQRKQAEASRSQLRHGQIGSGDRSERIRTYNFPQGRITDHRVGLTLHSLPQVLQGEGLETFIEALEAAAEKEAIDALAKAD
ncbi:hypothetical protein CLOM_g22050 [Closterium sp. NIES-68]|nr:hypothetical protein CLOM_g22050 [Closterium sp. NIES-68]GJP77762.1 hypothetical protein CLOP_g8113 [Closterium sp. NIES-67]